jgi:hypothetical protein
MRLTSSSRLPQRGRKARLGGQAGPRRRSWRSERSTLTTRMPVAVAGELPDAEQPADGIERGGDVRTGVGVHTAGDGECFFYDGHSHPFLRLRDGTHPLARRNCEPRPLVQARQIRAAPLAGAIRPGAGRQIVSQDSPDGVSRIGGQAGTQAPDSTPLFSRDQGSRAGSVSTVSCRI